MATRMTTKGQVTIPKPVRLALGLRPGAAVEFVPNAAGEFVVRPARAVRRGAKPRRTAVRGIGALRMTTDEILALTRGG